MVFVGSTRRKYLFWNFLSHRERLDKSCLLNAELSRLGLGKFLIAGPHERWITFSSSKPHCFMICFVLFWSQGFKQPRLTSPYGLEPLTLPLPTLSAGYSWLVLFKRIFRGHQDGLVVEALNKRTWWSEFNLPALGRRESTLKVVLWPQMHAVVYMFACIYTLTMMIAVNKIKKNLNYLN